MTVEKITPQLVKKGKGKKRPGYRGPGGYQGGRGGSKASSGGSKGTSNTGGAGNQNTGNARDDYRANYSSRSIVKGGGTKKAGGGYNDAKVSGDRGRSSAREFVQQLNNNNAVRAAQTGQKFTPYKGGSRPQGGSLGGLGSLIMSGLGMLMGIPGLGLLTGGFNKLKGGLGSLNDKLGDFREKTTGFRTQKEYEQARFDRQQQKRLDKLFAAKDRGYNQIGFGDFTKKTMDFTPGQQAKIDDLLAQGYTPSTARNVLTGRDLKGFTPSRMGLQTIDRPTQTFSFDNLGMTRNDLPSNNYVADAYNTPTEGAYGFNLIELDKIKKAGYDPKEVYEGGYGKDLIKSLEPSGYTDADFTNEYGYPMTAGLLDNIGVRPTIGMENTGLGFSIPTGDVGLNASGRLGNLSATVDAIDALKGESVNPELNYSGQFGNTNVYGNYSDDVQNLGLNFNNDRGLSSGISYDAITSEPRFDIGFRKTFEPGGGLSSLFTRRR